jgi:hypothetical protein
LNRGASTSCSPSHSGQISGLSTVT